jgi:hypothetical protein
MEEVMPFTLTSFNDEVCSIEVLRGEFRTWAEATAAAPDGRWEQTDGSCIDATWQMWHAPTQVWWLIYCIA